MADSTILPGVRAQLVAPDGTTTREFYRFFSALSVTASLPARVDDLDGRVDDLNVRVDALEGGGGSIKTIMGLQSVKVIGPLEDGSVSLSLAGDVISAPALSFYGALTEYGKGWQTFSGNFAVLDNGDDTQSLDLADLPNTSTGTLQAVTFDAKGRASGYRDATITGTAGRITVANGDAAAAPPVIDLDTVADAGGGALLRFVRDAWGRLTGTSAATTDDLTEGSRLYYTDARADARITLQKAQPLGLATLDAGGKLDAGQLPALAITETFVVASQAAMLSLTAQEGDVAVRTDLSKSFILTAAPASTLANWQELLTPASPVTSVFGRVGSVTAASGDYTFAQIASTPTTLSGYGITDAQAFIAAGTTAQYWRGDKTWQTLNKAAVGLGNVDNTTDALKPVSTAQAAADALRVLKAGDTMTGPLVLPGDPTAVLQAAPKQYVDAVVAQPIPRPVVASADTFLNAVGGETSATLTIDGFPLNDVPTVSAIHRTDWQGRQLLYATARTNAFLQSGNLAHASWSKVNCTATANAVTAPDGTLTAAKLAASVAGGILTLRDYQIVPAGTYPTRLWLQPGPITAVTVYSNATGGGSANFTLTGAGSVSGLTGSAASASIIKIGSWYLCSVTISTTASGQLGLYNTAAVAVGDYFYAWGAMSAVGVYIPTTTTAGTVTDYTLSGTSVALGQAATASAVYDWDGSGTPKYPASFAGPVRVGSYTLATLPSAAAYPGYLITVSDATAGPALCLSNGTNWIDIHTNAAVS